MEAMLLHNRSCVDLNDVVMGLHWTPPPKRGRLSLEPANLDAICVLLDAQSQRLEVVCPSHLTNANGSVVHTGDSRTGSSSWDDERIFVFVRALPAAVHSLVFGVVSSNARPFCHVAGASCHISEFNLGDEDELLKVQLTSLGPLTEYGVGTLQRSPSGWTLVRGALSPVRSLRLV
jgi:tellurium resistance protein TerD